MSTLSKLKGFFKNVPKSCERADCYQGRNCSCKPINFNEAIIEVRRIASKVPDVDMGTELITISNRLAQLGNIYYERYYGPENPPQEKNPGD